MTDSVPHGPPPSGAVEIPAPCWPIDPPWKHLKSLRVAIPSATHRVVDSGLSIVPGDDRSGGTRSVQDGIPTGTVGTSG